MRELLLLMLCVCIAFGAGCETVRPLCSTNFCVEGTAYPRSELEPGVAYDETTLDDTQLLSIATGAGLSKVEPTITMAEIVSDTDAGNTNYARKLITLEATIRSNAAPHSAYLTLATENENVRFFVESEDYPLGVSVYEAGQAYVLTLFIFSQSPDTLNDDGSFNIWSYIATGENKNVSVETLVTDAQFNNRRFQGAVLTFTGVVERNSALVIGIESNTDDFDRFDDFTIWKIPGVDYQQYAVNQSYTFTAFIATIGSQNQRRDNAQVDAFFIKP